MLKDYKFDIKTGHYILNEAEDQGTLDTQQNQLDNNTTVSIVLPSLNTEEVAQVTDTMQKELKKFDDEIARLNDNKVQLEDTIAKLTNSFNQAEATNKDSLKLQVIDANKKLLTTLLDISKKEKDKADKKNLYETQILQLKLKVNESLKRILPEKYRYLNESNIHSAKIYMKDLIGNDDHHILKGMVDFKRAFGNSNLLYGKDKDGYFVVAVDLEDFDRMYNTLEEVGYLRDTIIDNIMPLLFDRKSMVN